MALNATVGSADANSYVTNAEATAYFADRAHATAWISNEEQDQLLITATRLLEWYIIWNGYRVDNIQALGWPRTEVLSKAGIEYGTTTIPIEVKQAVYELAFLLMSDDRTQDNALYGLKEAAMASLKVSIDTTHIKSPGKSVIPEHIQRMLSHLTMGTGFGIVRLLRA